MTTDGGTDTADFTGHAGYLSPSQSDSGNVIVAVRNEGRTDDPFRQDGYIWTAPATRPTRRGWATPGS